MPFRRSKGIGPLRINLSGSGIGLSLGVKGFRLGLDSRGRGYTHQSFGPWYQKDYWRSASSVKKVQGREDIDWRGFLMEQYGDFESPIYLKRPNELDLSDAQVERLTKLNEFIKRILFVSAVARSGNEELFNESVQFMFEVGSEVIDEYISQGD